MSGKIKFTIQKYDPDQEKQPFEFVTLDEFEEYFPGGVFEFPQDYLGGKACDWLCLECYKRGYMFRFYSMRSEDHYIITVY